MTAINQDQLIKKATRWSIFGGLIYDNCRSCLLAIRGLPPCGKNKDAVGAYLWTAVLFFLRRSLLRWVFAFKSEVEDLTCLYRWCELGIGGILLPGRRHHLCCG